MHLILRCKLKPKEQCVFTASGGKISYNSKSVKCCSVNRVYLSDLKKEEEKEKPKKKVVGGAQQEASTDSWTFDSIMKQYGRTRVDVNWLPKNLYTWASTASSRNLVVPNFYGYCQRPNNNLTEEWCKTMLIIYKPWSTDDYETVKAGFKTYREALLNFMSNPEFPRTVEAAIRSLQNGVVFDASEGDTFDTGEDNISDPGDTEPNGVNADINDEAFAIDGVLGEAPDDFEDCIQDAEFSRDELKVFDIGKDRDWSSGFDQSKVTWFEDYRDYFYAKKRSITFIAPMDLFDTNVYAPEKCQGFAQSFLLAMTLHTLYLYLEEDTELLTDPEHPCYNHLTQGNPGTGKTFCIKTILNVIRQAHLRMSSGKSTAPTGCAASHSEGQTHHRFSLMPYGKQVHECPSDLATNKVTVLEAFFRDMSALFGLVDDECMMKGRILLGRRPGYRKADGTILETRIVFLVGFHCVFSLETFSSSQMLRVSHSMILLLQTIHSPLVPWVGWFLRNTCDQLILKTSLYL
jgi:hypothetical protein